MSEKKKTKIVFFIATITVLATALYWQIPLVLVLILLGVGAAMLIVEGTKEAVVVYVTAFIFGPLMEAIIISFGAWSYAEPHLLGFSIWLPFIWGNAGLFLNRLNLYARHYVHK